MNLYNINSTMASMCQPSLEFEPPKLVGFMISLMLLNPLKSSFRDDCSLQFINEVKQIK